MRLHHEVQRGCWENNDHVERVCCTRSIVLVRVNDSSSHLLGGLLFLAVSIILQQIITNYRPVQFHPLRLQPRNQISSPLLNLPHPIHRSPHQMQPPCWLQPSSA